MAQSQPPPELAAAIANAAKQYHVPADVLTGIWRIESGSSYPNVAVNSLGYGGLFGTTHWNTSPQDQANYSASILANLIQSKGSLSAALSAYSGGGYTSVPGESAASMNQAPPRPGGSGGGGFLSGAESVAGDVAGVTAGIAFPPIAIAEIAGGLGIDWGSVAGLPGAVSDAVRGFLWLISPKHWVQMFEVFLGSTLMLIGLWWLGTGEAGVPDIPVPGRKVIARTPAGIAAKAAGPKAAA